MFDKIHLWLNQNYPTIKHWLVVLVGILLLIFSMITIAGQNKLIAQVRDLSEQNKQLARDNKKLNTQTVHLGEENQSIAKQNRAFTLCIGQVFAKFTRDGIPVNNLNLETCTSDSQNGAINDSATEEAAPNTSGGTSSATPSGSPALSSSFPVSSAQNNTTAGQPQSNNSQNSAEPLLNCRVDILGLHIGCP